MKRNTSKFRSAIASVVLTVLACTAVSATSANTAMADDLSSATYVTADADAELAVLPGVFVAAAAASAAAFAAKAVYDVGVAVGEWAARKVTGRYVAVQAEGSIAVEALLD